MGGWDGSMTEALGWANTIHDYMAVANVNAFVWWWIEDGGGDNSVLVTNTGTIPLRTYVTGNWSKFVRPGWVRIDVTDTSGLKITAFKDSTTGQFAVVVVNSGAVKSNAFTLNGFNATTVTPWITDATRSLVQQGDVTVSGGDFSYTIPAHSVVTFAGQAQ